MNPQTRLGDYDLVAELASDPFGSLHRAVKFDGGLFKRHALVRRFNPDWLSAGLREGLSDGVRISLGLGEARGLAPHCRIYDSETPLVAYDLQPGKPLGVLIETLRGMQLPMGLEHVLTVMRDLAQTIAHIHERGFEHGMLNAHQIWVTYEGATTLLDATFAAAERTCLSRMKEAPQSLQNLGTAPKTGFSRDIFLLASLGWQMMTLESKVPADGVALLQSLDAWAVQSGQPLPNHLRTLFARMVGINAPFRNLDEFLDLATESLHAEEDHFSTFNLAFLMHTAFREIIPAEERAMKVEREALYLPPQEGFASPMVNETAPLKRRAPLRWLGAGLAAAAVSTVLFLALRSSSREAQTLRGSLAESEVNAAQLAQVAADRGRALKEVKASQVLQDEMTRENLNENKPGIARALGIQSPASVEPKRKEIASPSIPEKTPPAAPPKPQVQPTPLAIKTSPAPVSIPGPAPAATPSASTATQDRAARLLSIPSVTAPAEARGSLPAKVNLRVFVDDSGKPLRVMVVDGSSRHPALDAAATRAALQGVYQPAYHGGRPARDWVEVTLAFK